MSFLKKMPTLRSALEVFARGRKIRHRLPNGIQIYVSPDSQLKYLGRKFDRDLIKLAAKYVSSDTVVWDIGANCGVFAFSSIKARQVVAVEADPFLVDLIQRSMRVNGVSLSLVSAAASSQSGLAEFSIAERGRASNHLSSMGGRSQSGGERSRILIPTITLDSLLENFLAPNLVKIDVEGAELAVLRGATKILRDIRPIIYLETGDSTHHQCELILREVGYSLEKSHGLNWLCIPSASARVQTRSEPEGDGGGERDG